MRTHGLAATYNKGGCRCDLCRAANTQQAMRRRAERMARAIPAGTPHGLASTYGNWGCRCVECKVANSLRCKEYKARRRVKQAAS